VIVKMTTQRQPEKAFLQNASQARFSFFSSGTQQVTNASSWASLFPEGNQDVIFQENQKSRPDPRRPVWWIDVRDPTEREVVIVAQALSIHPLTAEDIAIREPREKVDVFKNYYLISFQTPASAFRPTGSGERFGMPPPTEMYIIVFQYGVVTFSPSGCSHVNRVRNRIRRMHDPSILCSDWICYALMYVYSHQNDHLLQ
jgi:Mg2+ and Co2+ transporter CorA